MIKTLLIDSEPRAREELRRLLAAHAEVQVVGEVDGVATARARLATGDYDLVLLEPELADGGGFELLPDVSPHARVVFVTAHERFAVRAFDVNALDYLVKPVMPARLGAMFARFRAIAPPPSPNGSAEEAEILENGFGRLANNDRVFLKNDRGARFVALDDLAAVVSCDNYTEVYLRDGSRFLVRRSLKTWEAALPSGVFIRVHRQALVNIAHIEHVDEQSGDTPSLWVRGVKQSIACSHRLSPEIRRRLAR
jgi:two-component system, LytTR family, response regulator